MGNSPSKDLAIKLALENKWNEAYEMNRLLLNEDPSDIDTLNRLAFSLIKLGKFQDARDAYEDVLKLDDSNPIALKNIKKLDHIAQNGPSSHSLDLNQIKADTFIEEAGKTKTVDLKNTADYKMISFIQPGDMVNLSIKRSRIFVQTYDTKTYIGMLPDTVGLRLIKLINGGNEYEACIKAIDEKNITVFIKEIKCAKKFINQPSFVTYDLRSK